MEEHDFPIKISVDHFCALTNAFVGGSAVKGRFNPEAIFVMADRLAHTPPNEDYPAFALVPKPLIRQAAKLIRALSMTAQLDEQELAETLDLAYQLYEYTSFGDAR